MTFDPALEGQLSDLLFELSQLSEQITHLTNRSRDLRAEVTRMLGMQPGESKSISAGEFKAMITYPDNYKVDYAELIARGFMPNEIPTDSVEKPNKRRINEMRRNDPEKFAAMAVGITCTGGTPQIKLRVEG